MVDRSEQLLRYLRGVIFARLPKNMRWTEWKVGPALLLRSCAVWPVRLDETSARWRRITMG
jgi:hypothetical protein